PQFPPKVFNIQQHRDLMSAPPPIQPPANPTIPERLEGFDRDAGKTWIYPMNCAERAYQIAMVEGALFRNTLIVLPTGLGKTLIAAVVMYNFYRWYPEGKIVFMAPTRP